MKRRKRTEPKENRVGQIFSKWTVLEFDHYSNDRKPYYLCRCECGTERVVKYIILSNGSSKSCGCVKTKNGLAGIPNLVSARSVWNVNYSDGCSFEKFMELSQQSCYYCGSPPSNKYNTYLKKDSNLKKIGRTSLKNISMDRAEAAWFIYNGLDRIDPSKRHTEDNIVPCCSVCNTAKLDMSIEEFKEWVCRVYLHFTDK
jgi:hypothetical protein